MSEEITIRRREARDVPASGSVRCGVAEVDVTPHLGLPMAGYSVAASDGEGVWGRLFARAFYLEDASGSCAAICVLDLMSGTRYVLERAAAITAPACGVSADRLLLAEGWWIRVEVDEGGGFRPLVHRGLDLDDRNFAMLIRRDRAFLGLGRDRWHVQIVLPRDLPAAPLRVCVASRAGFRGLEVPVP